MNKAALRQERFEALEAYHLGTMVGNERERFEEELQADAQLREELEAMRENVLAIELGAFSRTLKFVGADVAMGRTTSGGGSGPWYGYLKYAAIIAVVLGVAAWFAMQPNINDRLYAQYHTTDPGLPVPMSALDDAAFHDAMVSFKEEAYVDALTKWSALLKDRPTSDTLRYFVAQAALESGDPEAAIPLLEGLAAESASIFHTKAQWTLFLIAVRLDDRELLARTGLDQDPIYGEQVRMIRAELDR